MTITEDQLFALERQYWDALENRDVGAARALTDDPCLITGAQGVRSVDAAEFESMMTSDAWELQDYELTNMTARILSDDMAVLAYSAHEQVSNNGQAMSFDAHDASTWIRRGDTWVCAMHSESLAQQG